MHKQCVNCPGAVDHSTAECPIAGREQQALGAPSTPELPRYNAPRGTTLSESDKGELVMAADHAAAISVLLYRLEAADEWAAGATATLEKRDAEIAQLRNRLATGELTSVRCQCCQAEHSSDSYDAGFIAGSGMCQACDATIPAKDIHTPAARDVLAERQRQITAEGYDSGRDDMATRGQLAIAAGCYAIWSGHPVLMGSFPWKRFFPWDWKYWKPSTPRHNLIRAGALILAEIERLDRAEQAKQQAAQ